MDKKCIVCDKMFYAQRATAKFCSASCRVKYSRQVADEPVVATEVAEEKVGSTDNEWFESAKHKTQAEIEEHYTLANFPPLSYHSSGGGGAGTSSPPRTRN